MTRKQKVLVSVPLNFNVAQLLKVKDQMIQVAGGLRYWADAPAFRPEGLGARLQVNFLFPK